MEEQTHNFGEQEAFFRANSYLILPNLLSAETVADLNAAIDRDREERKGLSRK